MTYSYFEHTSDIGIRAASPTLEAAFEDGAQAMLGVMFDLDTIGITQTIDIKAQANDIPLLFVEVLNEVISLQGRDNLALKKLKTRKITKSGGLYRYIGEASGEPINLDKHEVRTEVKGATYASLLYQRGEKGEHILQCVLDV